MADLDIQENDDGSAVVDMPEMDTEEQADGSAIVSLDNAPDFNPEFYENLVDTIEPSTLSSLAFRYLDLLESDQQARELRDKQYEEGIRRT